MPQPRFLYFTLDRNSFRCIGSSCSAGYRDSRAGRSAFYYRRSRHARQSPLENPLRLTRRTQPRFVLLPNARCGHELRLGRPHPAQVRTADGSVYRLRQHHARRAVRVTAGRQVAATSSTSAPSSLPRSTTCRTSIASTAIPSSVIARPAQAGARPSTAPAICACSPGGAQHPGCQPPEQRTKLDRLCGVSAPSRPQGVNRTAARIGNGFCSGSQIVQ